MCNQTKQLLLLENCFIALLQHYDDPVTINHTEDQ